MSVLVRLASALGRNDEQPNIALAIELEQSRDKKAVAELAAAILGKNTAIANDAIKVLYELGERRAALIAPHSGAFLAAMKSRNNRLVWGAISALDTLADPFPELVTPHLSDVMEAAANGSVIAKDKAVSILAKLAAQKGKAPSAWGWLLTMLKSSAVNQIPMYAEMALSAAGSNDKAALAKVLRKRLDDIPQPAKRKRIEKVLKALESPKTR